MAKPKKTPKAVMAWAIVNKQGEICWEEIFSSKKEAEDNLWEKEYVLRVRILPVRRKKV